MVIRAVRVVTVMVKVRAYTCQPFSLSQALCSVHHEGVQSSVEFFHRALPLSLFEGWRKAQRDEVTYPMTLRQQAVMQNKDKAL